MAVSTSAYHSNSIQGIPQVGADANIFDVHTTPRYAVGHRLVRQDGHEFVYSYFGAQTNRGLVVAQDISESGYATAQANKVIAPASAVSVAGDMLKPGAQYSRFVEITLASVTSNLFAGGYLTISNDTGEGFTYRIKGNTATDNPATGNIRIELFDKIQVALDATTDVIIAGSKYSNLEAGTTAVDNLCVGVTVQTMNSGEFGWVMTKGLGAGLVDGTIAIGQMITLSDSEAGQVQAAAGGSTAVAELINERIIGQCVVAAGASTDHGLFWFDIS